MGPQKLWISARLWNKMVTFGRVDWMDQRRYEAWDMMEAWLWELSALNWAMSTNCNMINSWINESNREI